eukprot:CAMPEP_0198238842 /NCGR_PEP_ID=MMETSP1446-20131203/4387_1 /TAXON_ID=1461542 ORGANISM="Unidentified sp, Strain CCMP2111" /NCGR_SAMPLE_ID=MMETSP1446 /ASSEMBLY_ACC=CAM_ASM_001112 /LENGTH=409 /DNA_ID=CAMNT_0043921323 /DNA_START=1 /DNA_END=1230 /DNA_ORIENTATION=+
MTVAKPLFPIAGKPLVAHPILACKKIPKLCQVVLIGFYPKEEMQVLDTATLSRELGVPVTYVQEDGTGHGSAGGFYNFRELLLQGDPDYFFVLNCDVCSDYPLETLLESHEKHGGLATMLVKEIDADRAQDHGEVVLSRETGKVVHYAEKPETLVSSVVNCGIYVFTASKIIDAIQRVASKRKASRSLLQSMYHVKHDDSGGVVDTGGSPKKSSSPSSKSEAVASTLPKLGMPEVFASLAESGELFAYETSGFWEVLKTPGMSLRFSALYLSEVGSKLALARAKLKGGPEIEGNVYIHPDASVDVSAKIGPNVAIEAGAVIGPGVRLIDCIILNEVTVMANAVVVNAIVGWNSQVGPWARVQGSNDYSSKQGVSILAEGVSIDPEVVVVSSVILPHKEIKSSVRNEIVL